MKTTAEAVHTTDGYEKPTASSISTSQSSVPHPKADDANPTVSLTTRSKTKSTTDKAAETSEIGDDDDEEESTLLKKKYFDSLSQKFIRSQDF